MIDISKIDDKSITFNGNSCAAAYKASAGADEKGEFVVVAELMGEYFAKIRIEELTVNGIAQRSAHSAAVELNQFIGIFKKGVDGGNGGKVVEGSWIPSLTSVSSIAHGNSLFTKVGSLVRCQTLITTQVAGGAGTVQLNGLPYPIKSGFGTNNQYPIDLNVSAGLKNVASLIGFMGTFSSDKPDQMSLVKVFNTDGNISYGEIYGSDVTSYTTFRFRFDYLTD